PNLPADLPERHCRLTCSRASGVVGGSIELHLKTISHPTV
ncbi:MAG: hypothetical protein ACI9VS_003627, partial [Candidatus Binatia bacterium]